jgi:choice-of-anchor B domain-containing protein
VINQQTAYAYAVGTSTFSGGAHFIDISDPLNPTPAGGYSGSGYTHDAQVVIYDGPDPDHQGREIYVGSNENEVVIVDVTNKNNPQLLSTINYGSVDYTHQSWLTEDLSYLLIGDELDENAFGFNTRTIIADVSDLDAPFYFFQYFGNIASIDHNGYVKGNRYYLANYSGGMRVIDISNIANQQMTEIGYFDTFPANDNVNFNGTWNVYPFFESGNIVISGEGGFTLVKSENFSLDDQTLEAFTMSPNPTKDFVTLRSKKQPISSIEVHNLLGQKVMSTQLFDQQEVRLDVSHLTSGIYLVTVDNKQSLKLVID